MTSQTWSTLWRLMSFMALALAAAVATAVIFGQLRFGGGTSYHAVFSNVTGLTTGQMVRVAGVEVGKVERIVVNEDATVQVTFAADPSVALTEGTRAAIRYDDLIGGRYLELQKGAADSVRLHPGQTIPVTNTAPALDLDSVTGGFRPLLQAVHPGQINALSEALMTALGGQGATIGSFLNQAAVAANTLAERDLLIGQLIGNLSVVLGSLADNSGQLDKAVSSMSELMRGLAERKADIANAIGYTNAAAGSIAELLARTRQPTTKVVRETNRLAELVMSNHEDIDALLNVLPDKYQALNRQAIYGSYFSFYFCEVVLKLNGKGGQPVYTRLAGQTTGRCAPR